MIPLGRKSEAPRRIGSGARGTTSLVGRGPNSLPSADTPQSFDEEFTLRLIPSIKTYNIARFNDGEMPTLSKCVQPIKMFQEADKVVEDEEEKKEEHQGWNPALRKKRRRRRKDTRMKNWVIEENNSKTLFTGTVEGGVTSSYMLMVKVPNKNEFQVFPVEDWFRFKKPLNYRTLSLEEAEEMNNEKKRAVERWIMKLEKKDGEGAAVAPTTSMITGALKTVKSNDGEDVDIFAEPKAPRRRGLAPKKSAEVDATGDDGGDFTEIFSDDEGQQEVEKVKDEVASESSDDEYADDATKKPLTDEGKALQDLVKRTKEQSENPNADQNADKDDSDEEEKAPASEGATVRYDFYGNPIVVKEAPVAAPDEANANSTAQAETEPPKRPRDKELTQQNKRQNTGSSKAAAAPKLTEALLQEELIRYGGRMKTRDLLKKLKKLLVTPDDKAMFKDIVRTICDVEEDPIDGRYMVLKPQFR